MKKTLFLLFFIILFFNTNVYADIYYGDEYEELKEFSLDNENNCFSPWKDLSRTFLGSSSYTTELNVTFDEEALDYEDYSYQFVPIDYSLAKEIAKAREEYEENKKEIERLERRRFKGDSTITVESINDLINDYNKECESNINNLSKELPKYNNDNWKKLYEREVTYEDETGETPFVILYAKITDKELYDDEVKIR